MNTYAHIYIYIYTQLYINIHTCTKKTNIHTSIFTHKYSHININIYVYIYIYILNTQIVMYFYIIRHMVKILIIIDHCILLCTTSQSHTKPSAFSQQTILRNWAPWRHIRWKGLPMDQLTYGHCIRYSIHRLGIPKFYQDQGLSMVSLQMAITRNMMINLWMI